MKKIKAVLATMLVCSLLIVSSNGVWAKSNRNDKLNIYDNGTDIRLLGDPAPGVY